MFLLSKRKLTEIEVDTCIMTIVVVFLQSKMKKGPGTSFVPSNASLPAATVIHTGHLLHLMKQQV